MLNLEELSFSSEENNCKNNQRNVELSALDWFDNFVFLIQFK